MTTEIRSHCLLPQPTDFPSTDDNAVGSGGDITQRRPEGGWGVLTRGWSLRVSPEADGVFFREGEAPAEPRRDDSATIVSTRSPAGADPRDPVEPAGPACSACGSAGASPSHSMRQFRGRVSGQSLTLVFWGCVQSRGRAHRPRCKALSKTARLESRPSHADVCLGEGTANRRSASDHHLPDNRPSGFSVPGRHAHV